MARNAVLLALFIGFVGILVVGALNRTSARTALTSEARGEGQGHGEGQGEGQGEGHGQGHGQSEGHGQEPEQALDQGEARGEGQGQGQGGGDVLGAGAGDGLGQGGGHGAAAGAGESRVSEWITVYGTIASVDGTAMTFWTSDGSAIEVEGRPWQFALEQGFAPSVGDEVTVLGFHEDGEFKAGQIDNTTTGQSVTLRDQDGRPGWSGQGRRQQQAEPGS